MIYDRLENMEQYLGLFENLDICIQWVQKHDLSKLPLGRTEIKGSSVFVNVMDCESVGAEEMHFEAHQKYMDMMTMTEGSQMFQIALEDIEEVKPFDKEGDIALYDGSVSCAGVLDTDRFVVFMTNELHKTNIAAAGERKGHKIVFKIAR